MSKSEFEKFLSDSFKEGITFRELRLSEKEVSDLMSHYPSAIIRRTSEVNDALKKSWYEVHLSPMHRKPENLDSIRQENIRLKRELETLKKMKN
ncbi:hypothetical protein GLW00_01070 [Halobacillus litoralis]|uniref:Uncharacterized protein n=1 Tax=Halobacillus litoralis TaxID=45668 RepID=A0A845F6U7_9BACI|nr:MULTISPECIES: hypothetical protein [Halobacillus]MEC3883693.1 hypothetical protein [Halobacillus sp. HZG1]MYL69417.1 hypothetical protein [Halobacillus litoralis]